MKRGIPMNHPLRPYFTLFLQAVPSCISARQPICVGANSKILTTRPTRPKTFDNQGRAIVKLITHRGWARELGLYPMFMQIYAGSCALATRDGQTFEQVYKVRETTHAEAGRRIVAKRSRCCGGKGETRVSLSIPSLAEREAGKLRLFDAQSLRQERSGKRFNGNFHSRPEKRRKLEWGGPK